MTKPHYITIDLLRFRLLVCFHAHSKAADKLITKFCNITLDGDSSTCAGYAVANLRRGGIWIGPECKRSQIFHEVYHMTGSILKELNCNGQDEELNAHLNEFLCERVLVLWENNNKKRSNVRVKKGKK